MKHEKKGKNITHASHAPHAHKHSPFFVIWELTTLACVVFVGMVFLLAPHLHLSEEAHHRLEVAEQGAEKILLVEVILLIVVARDKFTFVRKNWPTILAALPFGGGMGFVKALKIVWHAFEKTRMGMFLRHPIQTTRRWAHIKLGLRV